MSQTQATFDRAAHCRRIASKGGRATYERHGGRHMQRIGRRGWEVTTARYFAADPLLHITWLTTAGAFAYFSHTGLQMKYTVDGRSVWPAELPTHPAHLVGRGQLGLFDGRRVVYHPLPF